MPAKLAIGLALSALACMIGGPLLAHFALLPPMAGLGLFTLSAPLGLGGIACGAAAAFKHQAYFPAMIGMLGCLPLIAVTAGAVDGLRYPAINDIATDVSDPPQFTHAPSLPENQGGDFAFPAANGPLIANAYPDMKPLALPQPPEQVYRRARGLAASEDFGWAITAESIGDLHFEAVAETRLFHWKDDITVRVRPDGSGGCIVDLRSKSREGKSDLGANARRIRHFLDALKG